jgi:hypothetical protein
MQSSSVAVMVIQGKPRAVNEAVITVLSHNSGIASVGCIRRRHLLALWTPSMLLGGSPSSAPPLPLVCIQGTDSRRLFAAGVG